MKILILGLLILLTTQVPIEETPQMLHRAPAEFIDGEFEVIEEELDDGSYTTVLSANLNISFFETDPYGQELLYFGAQWVICQLIGHKTIINDPTWNVSKVNRGELRAEMPFKDYTIHAEFMNDEGDSFLCNMVVTVYLNDVHWAVLEYNYIGSTVSFESEEFQNGEELTETIEAFKMEVEVIVEEYLSEGEILAEDWIRIPLVKAQRDEHLLELVSQGGEYAFNKAFKEETIPQSNWTFVYIDSALYQFLEEGTYYYLTALFHLKPLEGNLTMQAIAGYFIFEDLNNSSSVVTSGIQYWGQAFGS